MDLDPTTHAVLEAVHQAGYTTTVVKLDGICHVTAIDPAGERWRVSRDDPYQARFACFRKELIAWPNASSVGRGALGSSSSSLKA
jgi:hypothetical protein